MFNTRLQHMDHPGEWTNGVRNVPGHNPRPAGGSGRGRGGPYNGGGGGERQYSGGQANGYSRPSPQQNSGGGQYSKGAPPQYNGNGGQYAGAGRPNGRTPPQTNGYHSVSGRGRNVR